MKSNHKGINKKSLCMYAAMILGVAISTFGITNIHSRAGITEGGVIGTVLLLNRWFNIPKHIATLILDGLCYLLGYKMLGKNFLKLSIFATCFVSLFYWIYAAFPPLLPDLSNMPLLASVLGGIFVGTGVSLIVAYGAAAGGDDALALVINKLAKLPLARCYLFTDLVVLLLSLTYIPLNRIIYSLVTVTVSSLLIGFLENALKGGNKHLNNLLKLKKREETV